MLMAAAILAAAVSGVGAPTALGLLVPMEAGLPIPFPADLLMLLVGERAAAGAFPLWLAMVAFEVLAVLGTVALFMFSRGPGRALIVRLGPRVGLSKERLDRAGSLLERRGLVALAIGRGAPGLRRVTVVAPGGSGLSARRALPALILGASVFLQLHLFLGYFLGSAARRVFHRAEGPALLVLGLLVLGALAFWLIRRGRRPGQEAWTEAACPACVVLGAVTEGQPGGREIAGDAA
jgi:membrane protein DedA with SNARE-associated domain